MTSPVQQTPNPERPAIFQADGVMKTYHLDQAAVHALNGVSVMVSEGETLCIMGASGAGKSTLLHVLGGLDHPTRGEVHFRGRNLYGLSGRRRAAIRAEHIGFVFQSFHLLPELDIIENVLLPAMSRRGFVTRASACRARARELLDRVGLTDRLGHKPQELSGGEQQRVALARALMNRPSVVLADEPTGNLDSKTGHLVLEYLFSLTREQEQTLVIVTHNEDIAALCDRKIVLKDGRMAGVD